VASSIDLNNLSECFRENLKNLSRNNKATLGFHEVRGKNIVLSADGRVAKRLETSFCDAIVFTHRPVAFEERVYLRVVQTSDLWTSMIRFGFTNVDPDGLRKTEHSSANVPGCSASSENSESLDDDGYPFNLPKYVYPDLTNKKGMQIFMKRFFVIIVVSL
jgi:hypothetical protein